MQVKDLLNLLLDELVADAPLCDEAIFAWTQDPAHEQASLQTLATSIERIERGAGIMGLDGLVTSLQYTSLYVQAIAGSADAVSMAWLGRWYVPTGIYLEQPGSLLAISAFTDYLRDCPVPMDADSLSALAGLLAIAPALPSEEAAEPLAEATDDDVSLATDAIDTGLLNALLADAPEQLERLFEIVDALVLGFVAPAELQEAQRIAHTLKGSGNIIGLPGIGRLAHRLEDLMDFSLESAHRNLATPPAMAQDMAAAVLCLQQMVGFLQAEEAAPSHAREVLQNLLVWVGRVQDGTVKAPASQTTPLKITALEATDLKATPRLAVPLQAAPLLPAVASESIESTPSISTTNVAFLPVVAAVTVAPIAPIQIPAAVKKPDAEETDYLRVGVRRVSRMVRRAEQSLVGAQRLGQMLENSAQSLTVIQDRHAGLVQRLNTLESAVGRQLVELRDQGGELDPLEMDRYDALYTLARFITEAVNDEFELARQARDETQRAISLLRSENHLRKDQYSELLDARLVQVKTIIPRLKRNIAQTGVATGKRVELVVTGEQVTVDSHILARLTDPLLHLLRNAVDHGIESAADRTLVGKPETGRVSISFSIVGRELQVRCADDGRGLDFGAIEEKAVQYGLMQADTQLPAAELARMILHPGFSTRSEVTEVSGRGVGMDVVHDRITALKGRLDISSAPLEGTAITLYIPISSGTVMALMVRCEGEILAVPTEQIISVTTQEVQLSISAGGSRGQVVQVGERSYPYVELSEWLGFSTSHQNTVLLPKPCLICNGINGVIAVGIDAALETRELVLQDVGRLVRRIAGLTSGAFRPDGKPVLLLDLLALDRASRSMPRSSSAALRRNLQTQKVRILVVDDALSVRRSMEQLLHDSGYEVMLASDGFDALEKIKLKLPALVITDLEMPNLNGLDLTRRIRAQPDHAAIPVIMITSRASDKHRDMAMRSGVNLYLTKPFMDADFLGHVKQYVGTTGATQ